MNSNGLLSKSSILSTSLTNPQFLYKTPSNGVMTLARVYISTLPTIAGLVNIFISKMNILPQARDLVLSSEQIYTRQGTIITDEYQIGPNESIFVQVTNCEYCNVSSNAPAYFSLQVRGQTQIQ